MFQAHSGGRVSKWVLVSERTQYYGQGRRGPGFRFYPSELIAMQSPEPKGFLFLFLFDFRDKVICSSGCLGT